MAKLIDVCDFQGGTQPPKNEWIDDPRDGYVRMLQIRDYTQGDSKFIQYVLDTTKLHKCKEDDIMLSRYGYIGQAFMGLSGAYNVALVKVIKKIVVIPLNHQKTNVQSNCYNGSNNDICYCTIAASRFS
jgi:type I restriction enzyme S subunit